MLLTNKAAGSQLQLKQYPVKTHVVEPWRSKAEKLKASYFRRQEPSSAFVFRGCSVYPALTCQIPPPKFRSVGDDKLPQVAHLTGASVVAGRVVAGLILAHGMGKTSSSESAIS